MALKKSEENKEKAPVKKAPAKKAPAKKVAAGKVSAKKTETKKTAPKKVVKKLPGDIEVIVDAILEKKGQNVISLDLRKEGSGICDFFVICNADSTTNVSAIADNIEDQMIVRLNKKVLRSQGKENRFWIIQDYGDIVVHVFQTEYRNFYRLEDLWSDCEKKTYED
ncbi:MAG: ribosome silencing factor [Bacteroidales bacterium]|nr:ribosome silencing factor [Bacteroidales bacterium]